ncbi:1-aminocyclopropane-1-carboxylate deaminase/D-cysteine desulfhydrase [Thermoflexus sp.]|uniref:1-aminocyclopropane-1-carboxylate deaminase/D-cysteine desulfhydrase n=1 Tax=Thermoflexus sp. TaxID=1969742 RepID=UPI0025F4C3B5|nr:pyridoxal-phosphate dependent enzyme [Thermoflexus sp.]MDW8179911.1 pyridoxal-phosphate dependent enzyme [Anaerolineae bacterium]MCS6963270.1 pyridoxal-phosphate dependent enzyme [Thermoflexus sp.]MCS7350460.1 pyridoxal-phosphate dependent enzyme [Thermoflexus sp.]MCX7689349.1 pyridoxal-phosphate dependent enzyme [Thermoflexus sp.]MDW8185734.1 pyridoxal-phosphate dependent enzyme [Anaerolineae bacterium]
MDAEALARRLEAIPRVPLVNEPTPLEYLPRFSAAIGRPIYLKRDDHIGPAMGGNKARKLEYLLADALRWGHHRVVTYGGLQSNHARITAAAARRLGLEPHLFYFAPRPSRLTGNLLVNDLLGAHMHFLPFGGGTRPRSLAWTDFLVHLLAWVRVGRHYFIPVGGRSVLGGLGYVRAALELHRQAQAEGLENAWVVMAVGTGGMLAGLWAGFTLLRSPLRLLGIDIGALWKNFPTTVARLAERICARLGEPHRFSATEVPLIERTYAGPSYGVPSPEGNETLRRLARMEGILLDPIYTAKAFAGMLKQIEKGQLGKGEPVIFLHSGGLPALFAFEEQAQDSALGEPG